MKLIISTFFIMLSLVISAQEDVARNMINKTETSIFKSQKEMVAGHAQNKQAALSGAVQYQALAVEEFKNNNFTKAICYTSKAREYTIEILSEINLSGLDYYLLTNEEKALGTQNNCASQMTVLQPTLIDDSVLMSHETLGHNYKISIN